MREISGDISGPWCAIGDFNAILHASEKDGGRMASSISVCHEFQNCLLDCGLEDLGFKGSPFT